METARKNVGLDWRTLTAEGLAKLFDHTLLRADARQADLERLCRESREYGFGMVAINSVQTACCKRLLAGSGVHVGAAVGFPLGQTTIETKVFETERAIADGADEIDYVLHIGKLRDGEYGYLEEEMSRIVALCRANGVISKVIFENCYLTPEEITAAAGIARRVLPDYIKTSTGFGTGGARAEDVRRMKEAVGDQVKVKAAGGIRSWQTCREMLEAGAERIGTSASIAILQQFRQAAGQP